MKLVPKKGGNGYVSSYTANISLNAARRCGFIAQDGQSHELEVVEVPEDRVIIIKIKQKEG